jgi:hypothetical protein
LTPTTTLGGKTAGPAVPRAVAEAFEALVEEALTPLAHDLAWQREASANLIVIEALRCQEYDLGTNHIAIR